MESTPARGAGTCWQPGPVPLWYAWSPARTGTSWPSAREVGMSLSVCLLTRNQRERLTAALRSVQGVADEVIVADAASTDGTPEVAAAMQARVLPFRWEDDFAAGRNFA